MSRRVKRLEDIAFMASFHEILSNLSLCPKHRPEDKPNTNSYASLISQNAFFTSENILSYVRNRLSQRLIGTFNDEIRIKLIAEFNSNLYDSERNVDPWVFLDCVLDENILNLDLHTAFPDSAINLKLVETISMRSPFVSVIKFNFALMKRKTDLGSVISFASSLNVFEHLTSLSLCNLSKRYRSILMYIGHSCPKLVSLSLSGFFIVRKDILALILGKDSLVLEHEILADQSMEPKMSNLQLRSKYLTPICETLQHIQLEEFKENLPIMNFDKLVPPSVMAFLLRHMPNVQMIDYAGTTVSYAVKLLYTGVNNPFATTVRDNVSSEFFENSSCSKFSGQLSLTSLDFVNLYHEETMKAIPVLCPKLTTVMFYETPHWSSLTPVNFQTIIKDNWPKVHNITFFKVHADYRKIVLEVFNELITELTYICVENINLLDLQCCNKLESLRILNNSSLETSSSPPTSTENFLPNLKKLESETCLGSWSNLLQEKSSYTHLVLDCCHVAVKPNEWPRILKLWPQVQTLKIRKSSGLDMSIADNIFHQFRKLKELSLSNWMLFCPKERQTFFTVQDQLKERKIALKFERSTSNCVCTLVLDENRYETSEGNSSSDSSLDYANDIGGNNILDLDLDLDHDLDHYDDGGWGWGEPNDYIDYDHDYEDYDSSYGDDLSDIEW